VKPGSRYQLLLSSSCHRSVCGWMFLGLSEAPEGPRRRRGVSQVRGLSVDQGQGWIASWRGSRHEGHPLLSTHRVSPSETHADTIQTGQCCVVRNKRGTVTCTFKARQFLKMSHVGHSEAMAVSRSEELFRVFSSAFMK